MKIGNWQMEKKETIPVSNFACLFALSRFLPICYKAVTR
jgi:hypothetical protein